MTKETLTIEKINSTYIKVHCDAGTAYEMNEYFTFNVPGAKHMPAYKNKMWDGKIRLFNAMARTLYGGLRSHVETFAKERDYEIEYKNSADFADNQLSLVEAKEFVNSLDIPFELRDYQLEAFVHCVRTKRALLVSPTSSGKSFIIYLVTRYINKPTLLVVPTTSLVHQMANDFVAYGGDPESIHKIFSGQDKQVEKMVTITTWQSIFKMPKQWFAKYDVVIGDEAHLFKAKSLVDILVKMDQCEYRFGFTGTLDGTQTHKLVLEGLFGPVKTVTTTSKLIEDKHAADFKIKAIVLSYPPEVRDKQKKATYQEEIDFLASYTKRNKFLSNLALSLKGNTLVLFRHKDHGKMLHELVSRGDKQTFYIDGDIDGELRDDVRGIVENLEHSIIVASLGTFSTGINIRNLHNVVFAIPSKSRIKTLQSIGRVLRKSENKTTAVLYDVADDISYKARKNFTLQHFAERLRMYNQEAFDYKIYNVQI